jgi:hypothetical protein
VPSTPGSGFAHHPQANRRRQRILRAHGVTVHLRSIERRQIAIGDYVFGEHAPKRTAERDPFRRQPLCLFPDYTNRFLNEKHLDLGF